LSNDQSLVVVAKRGGQISSITLDIADLVVNQRQITLRVGTSFLVGRQCPDNFEGLAVII
jgi:hypothetical protein